jgi:Flp pilus assembly protein TadG
MPMRRIPRACVRRCRAAIGDERGVAAIEAALSVPFLIAVGAGLFEFGSVFYNFQLIQTGVRDAGRYLSRAPDLAAAEGNAKRLAVTGSTVTGQPARVSWWKAEQVSISYRITANPRDATTGLRNYRAGDTVTTIRVSTIAPYQGMGLLSAIGLGTVQITAAHEERYVGQ